MNGAWRRANRLAGMAFALILLACGSPPVPQPVATAVVQPEKNSIAKPLDLPATVLLVGRWSNSQAHFDSVRGWGNELLPLEMSLRSRLARPTAPINLSAPIEWIATLNTSVKPPQFSWGLSLTVGEGSEASVSGHPVFSPAGLRCREVRALGAFSAKVVCSHSASELERLMPLMTRALPFAMVSDANLSMRFVAPAGLNSALPLAVGMMQQWLTDTLGVATRNAAIGQQLDGLAYDLGTELLALLADLNGAVFQVSPSETSRSADALLSVPFRSPHSRWLKAMLGNASTGVAPQQFWGFPVNAQAAGYHWSVELAHLGAQRAQLATLVGSILEFRGLPKRLQIQARQLVASLPLPVGPFAWAQGGRPLEPTEEPWPAGMGWNIRSFGNGFEEVRFFFQQLVRVYDDPVVGPQLGRLIRSSVGKERTPRKIDLQTLPAEYPSGSFRIDLHFRPPTSHPGRAPRLSILFVPADNAGFAIAWGADVKELQGLLRPGHKVLWSQTLAGRAGLGNLNNIRVLRGGFTSLASLLHGVDLQVLGNFLHLPLRTVRKAPHRGVTPLLSAWQLPPDRPRLEVRTVLAPTSWRDIVSLLGVD